MPQSNLNLIPNRQLSAEEQYLVDIGTVTLRLAVLLLPATVCTDEKERLWKYLKSHDAKLIRETFEALEKMGDTGTAGT
jgi:hypothetical protein